MRELSINETHDVNGGANVFKVISGAVIGAIIGAFTGIPLGPPGIIAGAGAGAIEGAGAALIVEGANGFVDTLNK